MREIKIKVWDKNKKEWVNPNEAIYINPETGELEKTRSGLVVVQYTGLKDKNGEEIYEGYILKFDNKNIQIVKELDAIEPAIQHEGLIESYTDEICEIVGNVYENPELLSVDN